MTTNSELEIVASLFLTRVTDYTSLINAAFAFVQSSIRFIEHPLVNVKLRMLTFYSKKKRLQRNAVNELY